MTAVPFNPRPLALFGTAVAITPSDTLANAFSAIYVGVTGDITLTPAGQTTAVLFKAVPVGILPVACSAIAATGTTASQLVGLGGT